MSSSEAARWGAKQSHTDRGGDFYCSRGAGGVCQGKRCATDAGGAHTIQAQKDTGGHGQPADRPGGRARRHGDRRLNSFWRKLNSIKGVAELVR